MRFIKLAGIFLIILLMANCSRTGTGTDHPEITVSPDPVETVVTGTPAVSSPAPLITGVPEVRAESRKMAERAMDLLDSGDYKESLVYLDKAIDEDRNNSLAYAYKAKVYFELQDYRQAEENIKKALSIDSDNMVAIYVRGILREKQMDKAAVDDFTRIIEIDPGNAEAHYRRGRCYLYSDRKDLAKKDFQEAVELDPEGETGKLSREELEGLEK